jgi:citrate synthase
MARKSKPIRSDIAWSTRDKIVVRGKDLPEEIIGHLNLGDFAFLQLTGQTPNAGQSRMFNAILVTLAEHGITPSAIVARMTYFGAPEAMQAAVAAGLCGLGSVFVGSTEGATRMLYDALPGGKSANDVATSSEGIVAKFHSRGEIIPGLGHPLHKSVDPRTVRLFALAGECGLAGPYVELMQAIAAAAKRRSGKSLPINATGAIGAICCELGFPWQVVRGFGVMARAIGLVGHIMEEVERPMAPEIWLRIEEEASSHLRPKPEGEEPANGDTKSASSHIST